RQDCGYCVSGGTCDDGDCVGGSRQPASHVCRAAANDCDAAETCPAPGDADYRCPADGLQPAGTTCGPAPTEPCDLQDTCDGNGSCVDNIAASNVKCGDQDPGNDCDADDFCDGVTKGCTDAVREAGTLCGPAPTEPC